MWKIHWWRLGGHGAAEVVPPAHCSLRGRRIGPSMTPCHRIQTALAANRSATWGHTSSRSGQRAGRLRQLLIAAQSRASQLVGPARQHAAAPPLRGCACLGCDSACSQRRHRNATATNPKHPTPRPFPAVEQLPLAAFAPRARRGCSRGQAFLAWLRASRAALPLLIAAAARRRKPTLFHKRAPAPAAISRDPHDNPAQQRWRQRTPAPARRPVTLRRCPACTEVGADTLHKQSRHRRSLSLSSLSPPQPPLNAHCTCASYHPRHAARIHAALVTAPRPSFTPLLPRRRTAAGADAVVRRRDATRWR